MRPVITIAANTVATRTKTERNSRCTPPSRRPNADAAQGMAGGPAIAACKPVSPPAAVREWGAARATEAGDAMSRDACPLPLVATSAVTPEFSPPGRGNKIARNPSVTRRQILQLNTSPSRGVRSDQLLDRLQRHARLALCRLGPQDSTVVEHDGRPQRRPK